MRPVSVPYVSAWRSAFVPRTDWVDKRLPTPCLKYTIARDRDASEKVYTYRGPVGTGNYRIVICLTMSALPDAPDAPMPVVAPAFFSKIFQNLRLSSAAKNLCQHCSFIHQCSALGTLTSSSKHLAIGAQTAVEDSALVRWNLHVADQSRVAPDAERVVGKTA